MSFHHPSAHEKWEKIRKSNAFRNFSLILLFTAIAALFWFVLALNDNVQRNLDVRLNILNKPDSITFISDVPSSIHVVVRDKGTSLLRSGVMRSPAIDINFNEYATSGVLRVSKAEIYDALRSRFGSNAQISSVSIDSLRLIYTEYPGRSVPVEVMHDVSASIGNVIGQTIIPSQKIVKVYSTDMNILDTISKVHTEKIQRYNLSETTKVRVRILPIRNARIEPATITATIPVEPLVSKQSLADVKVENVPANESLLIFPSKIQVEYYVPMSAFNKQESQINLFVDYNDIHRTIGSKIPVKIASVPAYFVNFTLASDSVEYTIVK